ncbi:MAG: glycolate oxidase subunit GlcF [Alphaproteobacteria bacterium]|nr:glycolate oxidase subunit GlcF [Alphaproteobacteria bacterium]
MQTGFSAAQLQDPMVGKIDAILRKCVHCGFCTATCPTYVLLGDELDSPRGRIYQIKTLYEEGGAPPAETVKHLDRCLSCLSCMTTCPSGVDYMHLIDTARAHVERQVQRPLAETWLRALLAWLVPRPWAFRLALVGASWLGPLARWLPGRLGAMTALTPKDLQGPSSVDRPQVFPAVGPRRKRVALMAGCAQQVLAPRINEATIRLLTRLGCEVVIAKGSGCCGALAHHMGREAESHAAAAANVAAWRRELDQGGLDAVVINASGCGTTVKDYGVMLGTEEARAIAAKVKDVTELVADLGLPEGTGDGRVVAYHAACSLQHGQRVLTEPKALLARAGFTVREVAEGHLCCGSAGTYNLLQPELASRLRGRKVANVEATGAAMVAAGNIGCMVQIGGGTRLPVLHTVELLDWASGGPAPPGVEGS